jgi:hypothetical protein
MVSISNKFTVSLATLPVELVYRIFDNLDETTIHLSVYNTCLRLNAIIDTYQQYRVSLSFIFKIKFLSSFEHKSFQQSIIIIIATCRFGLYKQQPQR